MKKNKSITTLEEHFEKCYGKRGTASRTDFELKAIAFTIKESFKEKKRIAKLKQ